MPRRGYRRVRSHWRSGSARVLQCVPSDASQVVLLVGSARSGTTWISQVLGAIRRSAVIFEPLNHEQVADLRNVGCTAASWMEMSLPEPQRDVVEQALRGRLLRPWSLRETSVGEVLVSKCRIVKEIRVNRHLPWLLDRNDYRAVIFAIRHPLAVVESQLHSPTRPPLVAWQLEGVNVLPSAVLERFPHLDALRSLLTTPEQILAARWAVDQLVPLATGAIQEDEILHYDDLIEEPVGAAERLLRSLGEDVSERLPERVRRPSSMARKAQPEFAPDAHANARWRSGLTSAQVRRILEVVERSGLIVSPSGERGVHLGL